MSEMPNNSRARRDKNEKKSRRRESPPLDEQVPSESVESFLSRSSADSGFQEDDDTFTCESAAGAVELDNSLSSFYRESSSAAPKETRKEARRRKRRRISRRSSMRSPTLLSPMMAATKRTQPNGSSLFLPLSSYRAAPRDPLTEV